MLYYYSKRLQGAEVRYLHIEKFVYAIIHLAYHFRDYFLVHPVKVLTCHPIWRILHRPNISGWLTKWSIELSEYGIDFIPATTIKGHAITSFIVELTHVDKVTSWIVVVDGLSCNIGAEIRIVTPDHEIYEHSFHLQFTTSNNVAEYEATIHGLKLVKSQGASVVKLRLDSYLAARQSIGEFAVKNPK